MKFSLNLFLLFTTLFISCSEESTAPVIVEDEKPECRISSFIFEENVDKPHVYSYNNGNLISVENYYEDYDFYYEGELVSHVEITRNLEENHKEVVYIKYMDNNISTITHETKDGIVWLEQKFIYSNNQLSRLEWYRKNEENELILRQYFDLTYENGNIITIEYTNVQSDGTENSSITHYVFDNKINPFKDDIAIYLFDGRINTFINRNNILQEGTSINYVYEYNEKGYPTSIIYTSPHEETLEYMIEYACF